jgi:hypothetical protein
MTPATLIRESHADGVSLSVTPTGTIKVTGNGAAVNRWLAAIREQKAGIIDALKVGAGGAAEEPPKTAPWRVTRCGDCGYFKRIDHPHLGHCATGEPEPLAGLWDSDRRYCAQYRVIQVRG